MMRTLGDVLLIYGGTGKTIIFTETKSAADSLLSSEFIRQPIEVLHGDIAQAQREKTL